MRLHECGCPEDVPPGFEELAEMEGVLVACWIAAVCASGDYVRKAAQAEADFLEDRGHRCLFCGDTGYALSGRPCPCPKWRKRDETPLLVELLDAVTAPFPAEDDCWTVDWLRPENLSLLPCAPHADTDCGREEEWCF